MKLATQVLDTINSNLVNEGVSVVSKDEVAKQLQLPFEQVEESFEYLSENKRVEDFSAFRPLVMAKMLKVILESPNVNPSLFKLFFELTEKRVKSENGLDVSSYSDDDVNKLAAAAKVLLSK